MVAGSNPAEPNYFLLVKLLSFSKRK
jgi:hypothetical protein